MSERKLASVRRIAAIDPIEGADKIVCVTVDGWKLVSGKENGFKVGDLVIYFEIDSFLPVIPEFEWMRDRCYKNTENLGEGFRVRTIKLRGQVSQGLIVPLSDFLPLDEESGEYVYPNTGAGSAFHSTISYVQEGDDLTEFLKVQKYEKPIPAALQGKVRGNFPSFIPKTDQERIQNNFGGIRNWIYYDKPVVTEVTDPDQIDLLDNDTYENLGQDTYFKSGDLWFSKTRVKNPDDVVAERQSFEATLKLDGSSMTVYYYNQLIGVCSRNNDLTRDDDNAFWGTALASGLLGVLATIGINIAIQGELMGPGIQGNREKLDDTKFFIYDMYDIDRGVYLAPWHRRQMFEALSEKLDLTYVAHIPVLYPEVLFDEQATVDTWLSISDQTESINHKIAEGVVYKSNVEGGPSFKAISNKFLVKEED